jgi:hypothetical protein
VLEPAIKNTLSNAIVGVFQFSKSCIKQKLFSGYNRLSTDRSTSQRLSVWTTKMQLKKLWMECIEQHEPSVQESLLREAPHTAFQHVPKEFEFLTRGYVDLGFENLGLSHEQRQALERAFSGNGIAIPGTVYKMRCTAPFRSVIESAEGTEPTLPENWKRAVLVVNVHTEPIEAMWIGHDVREDQIVGFDLSKMYETKNGWAI